MKWISESFVSRARRGQRGQVLPLVALMLLALLGFVGLVTDVGRIYVSFRELQASTDAAALAGAEALPASSPTAISQATLYSGLTGDKNANRIYQALRWFPRTRSCCAWRTPRSTTPVVARARDRARGPLALVSLKAQTPSA